MAMMTTLDPPFVQEFVELYVATVWDATALMLALFAPIIHAYPVFTHKR